MNGRVHRTTDSTNSCDRIISFNSRASDGSSQHLSVEEKACLTFLEETIESMDTEDSALSSDDAQSSENTISENHHVTCCVHHDTSSCSSFPVTAGLQDLSAEEKDCLKFLEDTIDSIEDRDLSMDDAESRNTTGKKHHISQIKNCLVPTPLVLAISNGNVPLKKGMVSSKENPLPNKDNSPQNYQPSSDDASHWGLLSYDELCKSVSMIKTSVDRQPSAHGGQMYSKKPQNISDSCCSRPNPPPIAPKPKMIPSIAILNHKRSIIPNPVSNLHYSSTSENRRLMRPDNAKLKEDVIPENRQGLDAPLSSSFPDWPQKDQLDKSGMKLESSEANDEQLALQKLSHALSLSLPMASDIDEDHRWALRKLRLLKD
ncbi:hypothetical protein PDJAM_G00120630 [Pangasius djambal]|uniref:Uncharacterized protein n=1 Tax=Pangasius djambal TaxID=1691987 RepID=A0ACC5ZBD8_9TELE|nr:hypothetical protein [Pangasius djambal]